MKYKEISDKKSDELDILESKLRKELSGVRLEARMGSLKNTSKIGGLRHDIARVMTSRKLRIAKEGKGS